MKWATLALLIVGVSLVFASIETANQLLTGLKDLVVARFDGLFVGVATATLALAIVLGVHPKANVRLGPDGVEPEFSRFSWFSMLLSAGLASGLLYWAAAEPILHFQGHPLLETNGIAPSSKAALGPALRMTIFHWGLHGWGMYVIGGLAISIYAYRHDRPLTVRSALYPLLGDRWIDRWPGRGVDVLALLGTVFGVATSVGLSAAGLNATLHSLIGLELDVSRQIGIVFVVSALGVLSAVSGVGRGIRRLSETNVWISAGFLLAVFSLGPTRELLSLVASSAGDYLLQVIPLGAHTAVDAAEREWQGAWTVFYWAWWLAWMPFVSLFIARISRGRTVREFVLTVMGIPTLAIIVWMVGIGGTALHQELANPGLLSGPVAQDYSLGIVAMLDHLAATPVRLGLIGLAAFLLFSWLITSLDSATLVLCHIAGTPDVAREQAIWGLALAAVTSALLAVGGLDALQAASIVIGLPLAFVMLAIAAGLVRDGMRGRL